MTREDYCSYEVSKLLKEKGFDVYGDGSFDSSIKVWMEYSPFGKIRDISTATPSVKGFPAPTLQMAMKWLREVHNLYVEVSLSCDRENKNAKIFDASIFNLQNQRYKKLGNIQGYEQASEAAIKYCLENLI